jgi:hypothetical protein
VRLASFQLLLLQKEPEAVFGGVMHNLPLTLGAWNPFECHARVTLALLTVFVVMLTLPATLMPLSGDRTPIPKFEIGVVDSSRTIGIVPIVAR